MDRRLFDTLRRGDYETWSAVTLADLEDCGQHEMLNWFCLVGAMKELGMVSRTSTFIESSIMNSNKEVAIF